MLGAYEIYADPKGLEQALASRKHLLRSPSSAKCLSDDENAVRKSRKSVRERSDADLRL